MAESSLDTPPLDLTDLQAGQRVSLPRYAALILDADLFETDTDDDE